MTNTVLPIDAEEIRRMPSTDQELNFFQHIYSVSVGFTDCVVSFLLDIESYFFPG